MNSINIAKNEAEQWIVALSMALVSRRLFRSKKQWVARSGEIGNASRMEVQRHGGNLNAI